MKSTPFLLSVLLLILSSLTGCRTVSKDYTITYPAGLLSEHPKGYLGCYVRVVGRLTYKRPQDLFPPYSKDPLVCDKSGCIYVHYDYRDLSKLIGRRVKVVGYVEVTEFNFPYIDAVKVEELK
ncbi:MAG: hypothetical protein DSZ26_00495 [Thermovibrio sp.]|nr:MAG: hypothetical protein DSZ26_00495 [Thermovibrio sp.]